MYFIVFRNIYLHWYTVGSDEGCNLSVYLEHKPCKAPNRVPVKFGHVTGLFTLSGEDETDRNFIEVIFCGEWA